MDLCVKCEMTIVLLIHTLIPPIPIACDTFDHIKALFKVYLIVFAFNMKRGSTN